MALPGRGHWLKLTSVSLPEEGELVNLSAPQFPHFQHVGYHTSFLGLL